MSDAKYLRHEDKLLAIIIPADFKGSGIDFFTPNDLSQQMAYMRHPTGKIIDPHVHNLNRREVAYTNEALFVRRGRVRVDFYDDAHSYIWSVTIATGDVILLVTGGHGFEMLEESEMIEIKQGPFSGDNDKTRFPGIDAGSVRWQDA